MAQLRHIFLLAPALILTLFLVGCPKRPATTTAAAPRAPAAPTPTVSPAPTPGTGMMPGAPATVRPGAPAAPGVAAVPGAPFAPGAPSAAAPGAPFAPGAPGVAATPGAPGAGVTPGMPAQVRPPAPREFMAIPELKDIHFDFDKYAIRPGDTKMLDENAKWMKANPNHLILIEGHADERGTNEYNLALGERRAKSSMDYLVSLGIQAGRLTIISYGEERPICTQKNEDCWSQNRRAHFLAKAQ